MYTIKQVSKMLNCNANAIRFYEKKGLISPLREENGYRIFTPKDIDQLQFIILYRKLGFSIDAIKRLCKDEDKSKLEVYASQFNILNGHIHSMMKIRDVLKDAIDELLENNLQTESTVNMLEETTKAIGEMAQWKDVWNFDSWAVNYDTDVLKPGSKGLKFYQNYDKVLERTAKEVGIKGGLVAEIGLGTGNLTRKMIENERISINDIVGIDQSLNMLIEAKKKLPKVKLMLGTFLALPLQENCCDTIVSTYAFHHCNEMEKSLAIQEMDRTLRQGGRIIITDLMFENKDARNQFSKNCTQWEREDLEDEFFANVDELQTIFLSNGYQFRCERIDELIWMVVAQKMRS